MEIELAKTFKLGEPAIWGLVSIIVLSIGVIAISLFSLRKERQIWRQVAIGSIEFFLLISALYIYAFFEWWLALGPLLPFIIIMVFYVFTRSSGA